MKLSFNQRKELSLDLADAIRSRLSSDLHAQEFLAGLAYQVLSEHNLEPDSEWDEDYIAVVQDLVETIHIVTVYDL